MAHGITETDGVVFHKQKAWHGLGTIVEEAPTTDEALQLAGMDWLVLQTPEIGAAVGGHILQTDKWQLNVRDDTGDILGCVSSGYQPIQNHDLAKFANDLTDTSYGEPSPVKVESAGSLFGGKKVWFLLKTDTFNVGPADDPVTPYILLANGHDGSLSFTGMTTSVRVVCNNTLSWAMTGSGKVFNYKHTENIRTRLPDARKKMHAALVGRKDFEDACKHLRSRTLNTQQVQEFFLDVYAKVVDPIVKTTAEERAVPYGEDSTLTDRRYENALDNIHDMCYTFDLEEKVAGSTYWNAFNATSRWLQNRTRKGGDTQAVNKVMGAAADNTSKAFKMALAAAGS